MRMRKKPNLLPRMEACGALLVQQPDAYKGRWRELKPDAALVRLELGCGKGRFTAQTAAAHPEDLLIALERVPDAMVTAMERCRDMGLTNVFFIDADAAALEQYFAPDEVDLLYINFCDPWPSAKRARRRLTHEAFLRCYRQVLKDGGQIHFKTDNRDLFEWSLFQFPKAGFALREVTRDLHAQGVCGVMTDYEEKFHNQGVPINRCVGVKEALPDIPLPQGLSARLSPWEVRPVTEEDLDAVLALERSNPDYFALDGSEPTLESLRCDLALLPPRCEPEQKHDLVLWREGRPEAVLDLVEDFPREKTAFIGLLMVRGDLHRRGLGRQIAEDLAVCAKEAGFHRLRLACLKGNESAHAFWEALGYRDLRAGEQQGTGTPVWIMERLL